MSRVLHLVARGAQLQCEGGTALCSLEVTRPEYTADGDSIANVRDHQPVINIPGFGLCTSQLNPLVSAAYGVPQPCVPPGFTPWMPGAEFIFQDLNGEEVSALTDNSTCQCFYSPEVSVVYANTQLQVQG